MAPDPDDASLVAFTERLGYQFISADLLRQALVHRSWHAEHDESTGTNERLEFLGDAVLGYVIADIAFRDMADMPEGRLTDLRRSVVNTAALAMVARGLRLGEVLFLGRGEDAAGGRDKDSILADAFEAVLGAVHLDGGTAAVHALVSTLFAPVIAEALPNLDTFDAKTRLQEMCAKLSLGVPSYETTGEGPDHERTFTATVHVSGKAYGTGVGRTKKAAEQVAAMKACDALADIV